MRILKARRRFSGYSSIARVLSKRRELFDAAIEFGNMAFLQSPRPE
jgi:hypothetical protein